MYVICTSGFADDVMFSHIGPNDTDDSVAVANAPAAYYWLCPRRR